LKRWTDTNVPKRHYGKALFACGALAFAFSSLIIVPGELLKQRLQMGQIGSVRHGLTHIWKTEGIAGFYIGYSGVCLRDIPYTMLELGIYDNLKMVYSNFKDHQRPRPVFVVSRSSNNNGSTSTSTSCSNSRSADSIHGSADNHISVSPTHPPTVTRRIVTQQDEIIAGAITGAITGFLTSPLDLIKTKLMVDSSRQYLGIVDCAKKTIASGGIASLFQGSGARVSWLVPATAIYLPVYDFVKRRLADGL